MVAIPLLVAGLIRLIPKDIKDEAFKVLTGVSKRAATDLICDKFVVPHLGIGRDHCHKIARGIVDDLARGVRGAITG